MQKQLSKKDIKEINQKLNEIYNQERFFDKKDKLIKEDEFIRKDNEIKFFYLDNTIIPHLKTLLQDNFLPKVIIDMPAVKFITGGADVMRPGIKETDEFQKDAIIVIVDETHQKPLAIGKALYSSEELQSLEKGKVIKNLHFVGDEIWNS